MRGQGRKRSTNTISIGNSKTPLLSMEKSFSQKLKVPQEFNYSIDQMDIANIYRTFYPVPVN